MIPLTRLNGHRIYVNGELIKFAEASPDTTLALVTGEKLIVRETCVEVADYVALARAETLRMAWPTSAAALHPVPVPVLTSQDHTT